MYQALYRKYRPMFLYDVVGQDSIVKTLKNSIMNKSFSHAYMFFGPRGTGKTSISKIFARNINCLDPKDGEACGKCDNCKISFDKDCVDIIEIDAASNNGVDEIRKLIDNINLVPSSLKYKVYIIDEVHMLSTGAFNALLKTLEEPPEHVIFILATTDPMKVPSTIVSRCQTFSFKRIDNSEIVALLKVICKKEKIMIDTDVLEEIAVSSDGGLRDSLGMLDKLISFGNNKITMDSFLELNAFISKSDIENFCNNLFDGNIKEVITLIDSYDENGKNLVNVLDQIVNYLRNSLVNYYSSQSELKYNEKNIVDFCLLYSEKLFDIKRSEKTKIIIEMLLIKFVNEYIKVDSNVDKNVVIAQKEVDNVVVDKKEVEKENNKEKKEEPKKEIVTKSKVITNIDEIMNIRFINTLITSKKSLKTDELKLIDKLRGESFNLEYGSIINDILDGDIVCVNEDNVVIAYERDSILKNNLLNYIYISDLYNNITGSKKKLCFISKELWDNESKKFMKSFKNKSVESDYSFRDEPEVIYEKEKDDIIMSSATDLFDSSIIEVE